MINLANVNSKAVILALVEAHLSFSGMKKVQLRYQYDCGLVTP